MNIALPHTMFGGEEGGFCTWWVLWTRSHQLDWSDMFVCQFPQAVLSGLNQSLHRAMLLKSLLYMSLKHTTVNHFHSYLA